MSTESCSKQNVYSPYSLHRNHDQTSKPPDMQYLGSLSAIQEEVKLTFRRLSPAGTCFTKCMFECRYPGCSITRRGRRMAEHVRVDHMECGPRCPNGACKAVFARHCSYMRHFRSCKYCSICGKGHEAVKDREECEKMCKQNKSGLDVSES